MQGMKVTPNRLLKWGAIALVVTAVCNLAGAAADGAASEVLWLVSALAFVVTAGLLLTGLVTKVIEVGVRSGNQPRE